jgi:Ran GTPase-activating protein (RanGAP) involved in mRNA processing and transport
MIYIIYHLKNLLFFKNNKMDPFSEILKKIEENTWGLTYLDLSHHEIGEEKAILLGKALKKNRTVTNLDLSHNKIGVNHSNGLEFIYHNKRLKHIDLSHNELGDNGMIYVAQCISNYDNVFESIDLSYNGLTSEGLKKFFSILTNTNSIGGLKNLFLRGNGIEVKDVSPTYIYDFFNSTGRELKILDLSENKIGDNFASILANILKSSRRFLASGWHGCKLEFLHLRNNSIGLEGAKAFATLFEGKNPHLSGIDLSYNKIGDKGAILLGNALERNTETILAHLNLRNNKIRDEGATALATALLTNTALKHLDLSMNYMKDNGVMALAEAIKVNTTLTALNISENECSYEGLREIVNAFKHNKRTALTTLITGNPELDESIQPRFLKKSKRSSVHKKKSFRRAKLAVTRRVEKSLRRKKVSVAKKRSHARLKRV